MCICSCGFEGFGAFTRAGKRPGLVAFTCAVVVSRVGAGTCAVMVSRVDGNLHVQWWCQGSGCIVMFSCCFK
jgi:hypothetical protein